MPTISDNHNKKKIVEYNTLHTRTGRMCCSCAFELNSNQNKDEMGLRHHHLGIYGRD
jgi:hypothetical protein